MFQTTRRRLALWYTAVTAILLLVFATGVYFYARNTLIDRMDDTLKHVVEVVERSLVIQPAQSPKTAYLVNVEASFRHNAATVEDDHIDLEWFNSSGDLVWSTLTEPLPIPLQLYGKGKTVQLSPDHWLRQVTKRLALDNQILGYLRVSHPWFEVTKPIRRLIMDLAVGTSLMLIVTATVGWLLSGLAIKPVRDSYQNLKQFTADASHELRNPIAMIQMNVQMALTYGETEPQLQQRQLRVIERLTQRVGNLVNDLLFLARSDSGMVQTNYQSLPLDALLIGVIEEQRVIAQQNKIYLSLHILEPSQSKSSEANEDLFNLAGDWDQLARLFTNLISNALDAVEKRNQSTTNNSSNLEASVEVELRLVGNSHNRNLEVKVRDTGNGIPAEKLPYIFDRFFRLEPGRSQNQTGAGLGLAIVRAIVDNHQGQINVQSELNQGTTFTVLLPAIRT